MVHLFFLPIFAFLFTCSSKEKPRIYKEISIRTSSSEQTVKFSYNLPLKWQKIPSISSVNRFVSPPIMSFRIIKDGSIIHGTLIEIKGESGSIEQNVQRWLRQIKMFPMGSKTMEKWLKKQKRFKTKNNNDGIIIDLTTVLSANLKQKEFILASIIQTTSSKIFVKLQGLKQDLIENRSNILNFSRSIEKLK